MATANPTANVAVYQRAGYADTAGRTMTIQGAVVKTGVLLAFLLAGAAYTWQLASEQSPLVGGLLGLGFLGGFIVALVTTFFPKASPITAPIYAGLEGLALGGVSSLVNKRYPGIAIQAVELSLGVLAIMLFVYGTGLIRATERFKIGVVAATGAVFLVYLASMVLGLFHVSIPYIHDAGPIGICFSLVVVVIAALNLILDFDFIEKGVQFGAPKYMEWYGGFTLMVTLVWMYLEILRLLSKMRDGGRG
jgi:uncharacterized YccA/Bax inhibitor family protein